jgi:hypothetical protein
MAKGKKLNNPGFMYISDLLYLITCFWEKKKWLGFPLLDPL